MTVRLVLRQALQQVPQQGSQQGSRQVSRLEPLRPRQHRALWALQL